MTRIATLLAACMIVAGCASPYDGPGREPGHFGAGLTAGRVAGR